MVIIIERKLDDFIHCEEISHYQSLAIILIQGLALLELINDSFAVPEMFYRVHWISLSVWIFLLWWFDDKIIAVCYVQPNY